MIPFRAQTDSGKQRRDMRKVMSPIYLANAAMC